MKLLNKAAFIGLLCCCSIIAHSQSNINIPKVAVPSPNAASIAVYGQIPVSLFNGLPQISIPLGNVQAGKINVPISLNYHGGGIRPDHHPGWVGLGWDLQAGGVITRRVVGGVDETLVYEEAPNESKLSYYDHYSRLDNNNWASTDSLYVYLDDGTHRQIHPAPDEFMFNFGEYSGSFFLDHKGKWQVRSTNPLHLKVEEELKNSYFLDKQEYGDDGIDLERIFHRFTITTPDGCKYIFGGTDQSIEFTRAADEEAPYGDIYNSRIAATAWYLTKIISREGHEIDFTYERDGIQAPLASNVLIFTWDIGGVKSYSHSYNNNVSAPIINTSYLSKITAPNQTVKFSRWASEQLDYNSFFLNEAFSSAVMYTDLSRGSTNDIVRSIKYPRLDSISFYSDANTLLKTIEFNYRPQTDIRLTLDSIREVGANGGIQHPYQFGYNSLDLPPYNSRRLDHWGFYNGKNFFTDAGLPDYFLSRNSDTALMKKGLLTSIKYPTGGKSTFIYEAHAFSKIARRFPFTVTDTTGKCGGVRIRKIENRDMADSLLASKEYFYVRNFQSGGTVSSGIISDNPQYDDIGSFVHGGVTVSYAYRSAFFIDPLNFTNGNHVTYSEVTEKLADGGYTIYKYSNHDDGSYRDEPGIQPGLYMTPNKWKRDPGTSRALERGKLLLKSAYNAGNILLQRTKYDYDTSAARYAEKVRSVSLASRVFEADDPPISARELRGIGYYEYVFPRFLIKQTDTVWNQSGAKPLVTTTHYRYNDVYRLPSFDSTLTSVKDTVMLWRWNTYKYPFDMLSGGDPTGIYQKMVDSHYVSPQTEVRAFVNSQQMNLTKTNYYSPYPKLFAPQTVQVQDRNNPIETRLRYHNYDTRANILSVSREGDMRVSYLWNYKQAFPIAEIKNADTISNIAYSSFESDSTGGWNNYTGAIVKAIPAMMPPSGKKYYTLSTTHTLFKSGLSSAKTYILSYWTRNANAFSVTGTVSGFPAQGRTVNGWNYFEHKITGQTTITLSGTGLVDEVRLYPWGAQMTTFSFDPGIGMTSAIDANNRITYYEYDQFQRLNLIRDQDKNVFKKFEYDKYIEPIIYYNAGASGTYRRNNCTGCQVGNTATYTVADSVYTSVISQNAANQLAINDVNANGQAYANTNASCYTPPVSSTLARNLKGSDFEIDFHNNCTGLTYTFSIPSTMTTYTALPGIPEGNYTVTHVSLSSVTNYTVVVNGITDHTTTGWGSFLVTLDANNPVIFTN